MQFRKFMEMFVDPQPTTNYYPGQESDAEFEKQARLSNTLLDGWENWTDMQKQVHKLVKGARQLPTSDQLSRARKTPSTQTQHLQMQQQQQQKPGLFSRLWNRARSA